MVLGVAQALDQFVELSAELVQVGFQICGEFLLCGQLVGQILDVLGDGFNGLADLSELAVILGLFTREQGLHLAEKLGTETGLFFDFFEGEFGFHRLGKHRGLGVVAVFERTGFRFLR